jgi:hypothetical protein
VPNLTEQIYLDAELAQPPSTLPQLLQGAVVLGNDAPEVLAALPQEHPWSMTLTDAGQITGAWKLSSAAADQFRLSEIALNVTAPDVVVSGLLWISTGSPSRADALPGLEDWIAGLRAISLRTERTGRDLFPSPASIAVQRMSFSLRRSPAFPSAALNELSWSYSAIASSFQALVDKKVLPPDTFGRLLPLVWRRHGAIPMVQALPLTQSLTPPNFPSASRQLVPFELGVTRQSNGLMLPSDWRFGLHAGNAGAAQWPELLATATPAGEWRTLADLPLVSLSLPGVILDPKADPTQVGAGTDPILGLPLQYRFDLPYLDELHALAQLPKTVDRSGNSSPSPVPEQAPPLTRETFSGHWQGLSERASLAATDAVAAFTVGNGQAVMRHLVEPLSWPVKIAADLTHYPGMLNLDNAGSAAAPLALQDDEALAGVSGDFIADEGGKLRRIGPATAAPDHFVVSAGSMAAQRAADGTYRDQRGLFRAATRMSATVLRTSVRLHEQSTSFDLISLFTPVELPVPGSPESSHAWRFWFRDLPVQNGVFNRSITLSDPMVDVNDPESLARERNHLNGYEWRLSGSADGRYMLFGLFFFPLTLETVRFAGDTVQTVEIAGRLQLPLADNSEQQEFSNAVRLTFTLDSATGHLALSAVALTSGTAEWPLALAGGEAGEAPRLSWKSIALTTDRAAITISDVQLGFFLFDTQWIVPVGSVEIGRSSAPVVQTFIVDPGTTLDPVSVHQLTLGLDPIGRGHSVDLTLTILLGKAVVTNLTPLGLASTSSTQAPAKPRSWQRQSSAASSTPQQAPPQRTALAAEVQLHLSGPSAEKVSWLSASLFGILPLPPTANNMPNRNLEITGSGIQFSWQSSGFTAPLTGESLQLLPGIHVAGSDAPGFATVHFRVVSDGSAVPRLVLTSAFMETMLRCRWGTFLQTGSPAGERTLQQVFGSSAGDLVFGYTARATEQTWDENVLLNGMIEVRNLISWPVALKWDSTRSALNLPAARNVSAGAQPQFRHTRHTMRILLNQHQIPPDILVTGSGTLLFDMANGRSWQFLAVVEHQLIEVTPNTTLTAVTVAQDRRWTVAQEVRICSPATFKGFLATFNTGSTPGTSGPLTLDPAEGTKVLGESHGGYFGTGMRTRLAGSAQSSTVPELDRLTPGTLIVEASALHWISQHTVRTFSATVLQYLPNGTQLAALSTPGDFAPSDPLDPQWLLLTMPFLGRLQDRSRDGVDATPATTASPLQVDPVLLVHYARTAFPAASLPDLALAFAAWADATPLDIVISGFDSASVRRWPRLDTVSLEENWFRLQNPGQEPSPDGIQSVLAALPDTAARLSRPVVLHRAFEAILHSYPPALETPSLADPSDAVLLWRSASLLGLQGISNRAPAIAPPYGWVLNGLEIITSAFGVPDPATSPRTFAAATVLPVHPATTGAPLAFAVSPYLSIDFRPDLGQFQVRLVFAELLCLNAASKMLRPVASRVWEITPETTREIVATQSQQWATESHLRLAPDSPFAIVRFREVNEPISSAGQVPLTTTYSFAIATGAVPATSMAKHAFRLRSPVLQLRFRDGHFGGSSIPGAPHGFELAPPQVVGMQPLRLNARPAAPTPGNWPWGMSALNVNVRYTGAEFPALGYVQEVDENGTPAGALTLWWQAPQHRLLFRAAATAEGPTAGLPPLFRAPAIRGLLPQLANPPMPALASGELADTDKAEFWQPVLPGSLRYLLTGVRPGALLAFRHQLLSQSLPPAQGSGPQTGDTLVSGSIPVQHRFPRPVPLPANRPENLDTALCTWASYFDAQANLLATPGPADEAFFAAEGGEPAHRLQLTLIVPALGTLPLSWDGQFVFAVRFENEAARSSDWVIKVDLIDGERAYAMEQAGPETPGVLSVHISDDSFLIQLAGRSIGSMLVLRAQISRTTSPDGFFQTLTFPLRVAPGGPLLLPLVPSFIYFEDPEYNRYLASATAHSSTLVKTVENAQPVLRSVSLAADRQRYTPESRIALRYDWDDDSAAGSARLIFKRIDSAGVQRLLRPATLPAGTDSLSLRPGTLAQLAISALQFNDSDAGFQDGDRLQLELQLDAQGRISESATVILALEIVTTPVQPVPDAAYALLRQSASGAVECVRFAWAPEPQRVELVSASDLRTEVVRRRAVFLWSDTRRRGSNAHYALQKITRTGSVNQPLFAAV